MYRTLIPAVAAIVLIGAGVSIPADAQKATTGSGSDTSAPTMQKDMKKGMSPGTGTGESATAPAEASFDASELMGKDVVDVTGEQIATIEKVIPKTGAAQDVVLSVGGILSIGAKQVRYPANKIERGANGELRVSATKEELSKLPAEGEMQSK